MYCQHWQQGDGRGTRTGHSQTPRLRVSRKNTDSVTLHLSMMKNMNFSIMMEKFMVFIISTFRIDCYMVITEVEGIIDTSFLLKKKRDKTLISVEV